MRVKKEIVIGNPQALLTQPNWPKRRSENSRHASRNAVLIRVPFISLIPNSTRQYSGSEPGHLTIFRANPPTHI